MKRINSFIHFCNWNVCVWTQCTSVILVDQEIIVTYVPLTSVYTISFFTRNHYIKKLKKKLFSSVSKITDHKVRLTLLFPCYLIYSDLSGTACPGSWETITSSGHRPGRSSCITPGPLLLTSNVFYRTFRKYLSKQAFRKGFNFVTVYYHFLVISLAI